MVEGNKMDEPTSLDDALGEPKPADPVIQEESVEAKTETPAETPAEDLPPESELVPLAGLRDERQKRQTAEQQLAESKQMLAQYEGYLKGMTTQTPQEETKPVDFFEDPSGYVNSTVSALEEKFNQQVQQTQKETRNQIFNMSEALVASTHEDFPEVKQHFLSMAEKNPNLAQKIMDSQNPWLAAYELGKQDMELSEVGDVSAYKDKIRDELKAEVMAELKAELEASGKTLKVPESLVNHPSKGGAKPGDWGGPTSLDAIGLGD